MMRSWKFWVALGGVLGVVAMFSYGLMIDPKLVKSPLLDQPAPTFTVTRLNGTETLSLADLRGKSVVLNFWASWCVACREEARVLQEAYLDLDKGKGQARVIGIAIQDTPEAAQAFATRYGKTYFLALDNKIGEISLNFGLYGVPETFFIDLQGVIRFKKVGAVTRDEIYNYINQMTAMKESR
ncbi:MAG: redoxin domain-containing protein [Candidatus Lambdaproteobacteria bacterium]|nr:redoxin domain-containing protein [Candidatus Lambdaproteobacteria bacterium]